MNLYESALPLRCHYEEVSANLLFISVFGLCECSSPVSRSTEKDIQSDVFFCRALEIETGRPARCTEGARGVFLLRDTYRKIELYVLYLLT